MGDMNIHVTWLTHVRTGPKKKIATVPDALLKLLVKDKPLYSGKVRKRRETKPPRREERG